MSHSIVIRGARQNNLKNLDLELPTNELIVVTGVSGSGKSSLVFDTIYAEGQRRYVETFSPYARQFLDRMDRPQVERIEGIPPAIAIDQTNPVRTSRSTVGTMTELNDHLKLLFSRAAQLYCRDCGAPVRRDSAQSIYAEIDERLTARAVARLPARRDVPGAGAAQLQRDRSARSAGEAGLHARVRAQRAEGAAAKPARKRKKARRKASAANGRPCRPGNDPGPRALRQRRSRSRDRSAGAALRVGRGRVASPRARRRAERADARLALLLRPALRRLRHSLPRADAEPVLVQFAARRLRELPRLRPHHRHRLRSRSCPTKRNRCAAARCGRGRRESYRECQDDLVRFARKRGMPLDTPWRELERRAAQVGARRRGQLGRQASGTACAASSRGSRPRRTRCTSACCCRSIARTRRARRAAARA